MRLSPDISFYFPPRGNFLPPSDKLSLDTIVPTHGEIFPILLQVHYLMVLGEGGKKIKPISPSPLVLSINLTKQ